MKKLTTILLFFATTLSAQKIPIEAFDIYQSNINVAPPDKLLDGDINTEFIPDWQLLYKPHDVIIDVSKFKPTLTSVRIYDGNGGGFNTKLLVVNANGDTTQIGTFTGTSWPLQWVTFPIPNLQAVTFIMRGGGGPQYGNELELYGSFTPYTEPTYNRPRKPLKNMMGVVGHPWDIDKIRYPEKYAALVNLKPSSIRLYSDAYANKDLQGNWAMNPTIGAWWQDSSLWYLKKDIPGFVSHLCYQNQSLAVRETWTAAGKQSHINIPYQFNANREDLLAHLEMGKDLFVLASRGGKNTNVPDYPVYQSPNWYDPKNLMIKGGGFYDAIEGGNEWIAWWKGYDGCMDYKQLAAASSIHYDGHKGDYPGYGIKNADPSMIVSSNGLASDKPDIFRGIVDWSKTYRNGSIPLDVLQIHCYSSIGGQYSGSKGGLPPETGMLPQVKNMVRFSNQYAQGKEVWIGEWGWDVHPGSPLNAPAYGKYTAHQTSGNWTIRGMVVMSAAGLDRAQFYRLYQEYYPSDPVPNYTSDNNPQQFATMSLMRQMDNSTKNIQLTLTGKYFKQMGEFGDYVFDRIVSDKHPYDYRFKNGTKEIAFIWNLENMTIVDGRPSFTENTGIYNLPAGSRIRRFTDGDEMSSEFGNFVAYGSAPVVVELGGSSLPVKLLSWTATKQGKSVLLKWSVEESEFSHYEVEKSADGVNFTKWATVIGGHRDYSMYDLFPFPTTYYRLKMVDLDGSYSYSRVISIRMNGSKFKVYNLAGQEVQNPRSGFYLKVYEDGTKEYIKL
jgi:hypothetical protein